MGFKSLFSLLTASLLLSACTGELYSPYDDENIIGSKLDSVSSLSDYQNEDSSSAKQVVSLFEPTTRKIHQFDLNQMTHKGSLSVKFPNEEHFVLYNRIGNFTVDLTLKHISVYDSQGQAQHDPIGLNGTPEAAAFRPDLGYLVIYDNLSSVGILKMNVTSGAVEKAWVGGPILEEDSSIVSGDLDGNGNLVLALNDGRLAIVDIEQSLDQKQWVFSTITTPYNQMVWLSPVAGSPDQVLIHSNEDKLVLFDTSAETALDEVDLSDDVYRILKYSKTLDSHIIVQRKSYKNPAELFYVKNSQIKVRSLSSITTQFMHSHLDLQNDRWTLISSGRDSQSKYNTLDEFQIQRNVSQYQFSTMLSIGQQRLPDQAKLKLASNFIFALFPSELGYATRIDVLSGEQRELKLFNVKHIK